MGNSLSAYRYSIGTFNGRIKDKGTFSKLRSNLFSCDSFDDITSSNQYKSDCIIWRSSFYKFTFQSYRLSLSALFLILQVILLTSNDIELNPGPDKFKLDICHCNIRSIRNKVHNVRADLSGNFDIITISESWLKSSIKSDILKLAGYQMPVRRDRNAGIDGYGGVLAWVANDIAFKRRVDLESSDLELLWLEIRLKSTRFLLGVIYRPPKSNDTDFWNCLKLNISHINEMCNAKLMLIGDLNADFDSDNGARLTDFCAQNNLMIHNHEPTHFINGKSTVLDQCLTNFGNCVNNVDILPPIGRSDHCILSVSCDLRLKKPKVYKRLMWDFSNANFAGYRNDIANTDWSPCFEEDSIDGICLKWTNMLLDIAKRNIPNKVASIRPNDKKWYNGFLRRLKRSKLRKFKAMTKNPTAQTKASFITSRNLYDREIEFAKNQFENNKYTSLANDASKNNKKWWSLLKAVLNHNDIPDGIPPLTHGGQTLVNDVDKANAFNDYFLSISSVDDSNRHIPDHNRLFDPEWDLRDINISIQDVSDQTSILNSNKSYGPDGIHPTFIKEGGAPLNLLLQRLFNTSLQLRKFPLTWKSANVVPLHKKDLKCSISNYRPISLLSTVSKIFEKVVFKYIFNHFRDNFILSNFQHGFLPGKSTCTQLLEVFQTFCSAVDMGKEVRVIFLDISKAFDKVWHKGLIFKLKRAGISGNLLEWLIDYLSNRRQRVVINGQHSDWGFIQAGVPQGSVLGPLLFLLFINDITDEVDHCKIRLFADDTCLFIEVDNREEAVVLINHDLNKIHNWSNEWLITFSPPKTKSLTISNKKDRLANPQIYFANVPITEVNSHCYLGLNISYDLRWNCHLNLLCEKANSRLNMMRPLKFKLDRHSLETMYMSFVRPIMDYGITIWGGTYDSNIAKLEQIQIAALRIITGATERSNIVQLYHEVPIPSISLRRDNQMAVMMYKIYTNPNLNFLQDLLPIGVEIPHHYDLRRPARDIVRQPRLTSTLRSFFYFGLALWNQLPNNIRQSESLSIFKKSIYEKPDKNVLYYYGERWSNIHHSRIRIGCSKLNADLCFNLHVRDNPSCVCGAPLENSQHFFTQCPLFTVQRNVLRASIAHISPLQLDILLHGNTNFTLNQNKAIFDAVHTFIKTSERFA